MKKLFFLILAVLLLCGCTNTLPASEDGTDCILREDKINFSIVDRSLDNPDLAFAQALEPIFEDEENVYSLPCIKSDHIIVKYADGTEENVVSALSSGRISIKDLNRFDIGYITEQKEHIHAPSEDKNVVEHEFVGYCGNTMTTVAYHGYGKNSEEWEYSFWGGVSVDLTDLLRWFDYSEEICKCLPEYTVTTEFGLDYGINLTEGYVRYDGKQVSLTDAQTAELKEMLDKVYDGYINNKMPGANY